MKAEQVEFSLSEIEPGDWSVRSNFESQFGLDSTTAHKVGLEALMVVSRLNERLEWMNNYSAVSGFRVGDVSLVDEKIAGLTRELEPSVQQERLTRVLEITGLPDIEGALAAGEVDIRKLVEIVETRECQDFRDWLRTVDSEEDDQIKERVESLRERLRAAVHGGSGKAVRFGVSALAGQIPVAGLVAGPAVSVVDSFLLERIVRLPGPTTFLSRLYPSIFEGS